MLKFATKLHLWLLIRVGLTQGAIWWYTDLQEPTLLNSFAFGVFSFSMLVGFWADIQQAVEQFRNPE